MTRLRKTYADLVREVRAQLARGASEERTLALKDAARPKPVEGRAPNQREFQINDDYAWELFRPPPSMLPEFPRCWTPKVELDD